MIQIDIKMPTCCSDCPLVRYSPWGTFCNLNSYIVSIENLKTYSKSSKPDWCPLKEVGDIEALKNQPKTTYLIRKQDGHQVYWQCANCRNYHSVASNYCSICGAKIKGWKEEEDNEHDNR